MDAKRIAVTVVSGFLGAGKTTLLNRMVRRAEGSRLAVIVNDFGELNIDAAIVSEVASWGNDKLSAHGLGAYIAHATDAGDFPRIVLGVAAMSLFVVTINRVLWRPMYAYATRRLTLD